jgi:hypothetical protein
MFTNYLLIFLILSIPYLKYFKVNYKVTLQNACIYNDIILFPITLLSLLQTPTTHLNSTNGGPHLAKKVEKFQTQQGLKKSYILQNT